LCRKLEVSQKYYPALIKIKVRHQTILKRLLSLHEPRPSQIYQILSPFSLEQLLYAMAKSTVEDVKKKISYYLSTLRKTEILLTGKDLKSLGYRPGPIFKKIMKDLLEAKLDGEVKTRQDEVDYVKRKFPDTGSRK
jgi:tRNA nucleotidyltransferase (CCA-adding enzyme)